MAALCACTGDQFIPAKPEKSQLKATVEAAGAKSATQSRVSYQVTQETLPPAQAARPPPAAQNVGQAPLAGNLRGQGQGQSPEAGARLPGAARKPLCPRLWAWPAPNQASTPTGHQVPAGHLAPSHQGAQDDKLGF